MPEALTRERPPFRNGRIHVKYLPLADLILAETTLLCLAMEFNARIVTPRFHGPDISEKHATAALPQISPAPA
jgi:hypothetical protein